MSAAMYWELPPRQGQELTNAPAPPRASHHNSISITQAASLVCFAPILMYVRVRMCVLLSAGFHLAASDLASSGHGVFGWGKLNGSDGK